MKANMAKHKLSYIFRAYRSFDNSYSCITAVKWNACHVRNTAGKARRCRIHWNNSSRSHPGRRTGLKCSCGKIFHPAYQDPGWKNRDLEIEPSQLALSYGHNENFTKDSNCGEISETGPARSTRLIWTCAYIEARRDLRNRG